MNPFLTTKALVQFIQNCDGDEAVATTNDRAQMTSLHLLAVKPNVKGEMITACLDTAPNVFTVLDSTRRTALQLLCSPPFSQDASEDVIKAFIGHVVGIHALKSLSPNEIPLCNFHGYGEWFVWWAEQNGIDMRRFYDSP